MLNQYLMSGREGSSNFFRHFGDYGTTDEIAIQVAEESFQHRFANLKPGDSLMMVLWRESKLIKEFPRVEKESMMEGEAA